MTVLIIVSNFSGTSRPSGIKLMFENNLLTVSRSLSINNTDNIIAQSPVVYTKCSKASNVP